MKGKKWVLAFLIGLGLFVEHYIRYSGFDFELIGHEVYGMILIVVGVFMFYWSNRKSEKFEWDAGKEDEAT